MSVSHYRLLDAAKLLQRTRGLIKDGDLGNEFTDVTPKKAKYAAGLTRQNLLVITGSRGFQDYKNYNLRPNRDLPSMVEVDEIVAADLPKEAYHQGFLLHAAGVMKFLDGRRPSYIIGHSLGAASAQILGTHFQVPTVCLASPQVVKRRFLDNENLSSKSHRQWNVFNMAWRKDFVTQGYRMTGLRCLGHRVVVDSNALNFGIDHFVKDYERLLVLALDQKVVGLPHTWPDPKFKHPVYLP